MNPDYWAHCRGVNGTRAVYKHYYSEWDARLSAENNWKWEHPNERLVSVFVDCVEVSYETVEG